MFSGMVESWIGIRIEEGKGLEGKLVRRCISLDEAKVNRDPCLICGCCRLEEEHVW